MRCSGRKLLVDLMPDHSVRLTIRCDGAYEAALLHEDICEAARKGSVILDFEVTDAKEVKPT